MNKEIIIAEAQSIGLKIGEITCASNDYPKGLGDYAITGFDTIEDVEEFAVKHNLSIGRFSKRDGSHFWHYKGSANEPIYCDEYIRELGDEYSLASINNENIKYILTQIVNDFTGEFNHLKDFIEKVELLRDEIESKCVDEVVIVKGFDYIETVKKELMTYHADVTRVSIGVLLKEE